MNPESIINAYENGERDLDPLLEKMGWTSWLGVAELGLVMNSEIVEFLEEKYKEENDKSESDESILLDLENRINTAKTEYEDLGGTYD